MMQVACRGFRDGVDNKANPARVEAELLRDVDVAAILQINKSTIWGWFNSGKIPAPVKIGGTTRWRRREILAWIDAGCPPRVKWQWGATRN